MQRQTDGILLRVLALTLVLFILTDSDALIMGYSLNCSLHNN